MKAVHNSAGPVDRLARDDELEDFFENATIGLHIVAADGTILRANKAELAMLGYTADEYVGKPIADFHADAPVIGDILDRLSRGERLDRYPARLRAKDGSIRHVLISSSGLFRDGKFIQTRCFTIDVTDARAAEKRYEESEHRFQTILEALPTALYTTDEDGIVTFYNKAAAKLAGREPIVGEDRWCVTRRLYDSQDAPLPLSECPMAVTLREQKAVRGAEVIAERPDGSRARLIPYPTPLFDKRGKLTGAVNMLVDITDRHAAERDAARLAAIVLSSQDAIVTTTTNGVVTFWSNGAENNYGYEANEIVGESILRIIPPELHGEEKSILERVRKGEHVEHYETERITKNGERVNVSLTVSLMRDRSGKTIGIAKVGRDITQAKNAERMQKLLIGELSHRVKNTLATVQAIANQTLKNCENPEEIVKGINGRIGALAKAHSVLTDNSWEGADLSTLMHDQLLLGGADADRISCSGPSVILDPQAALHFSLILHELGTNARKYGSLSEPQGRVAVDWSVEKRDSYILMLRWREQHGPAVKAPTRRGFGTTLIEQTLRGHGGEAKLEYKQNGVLCEISLPLSDGEKPRIGAYVAPSMATSRSTPGNIALCECRVLIVEDEPLIAMEIKSILEDEGCDVIGPASDLDEAERLVQEADLHAALLDVNLGGHDVSDLVAALTRRNIPFAFVTGYAKKDLPETFQQAPLITKPIVPDQIIAMLNEILTHRDSVIPLRGNMDDRTGLSSTAIRG